MEFLGNTIGNLILSYYNNLMLNMFSWKQELHNKSLQGCSAYFKINGSKMEAREKKKKEKKKKEAWSKK